MTKNFIASPQDVEGVVVSFTVDPSDVDVIDSIATRARKLAKDVGGWDYDYLDAIMDITACHANGNPLDLDGLLAADDANFGHDVFGIRRHIDRDTGKLLNCFSPRFSRR
jgi:hypothetical protein